MPTKALSIPARRPQVEARPTADQRHYGYDWRVRRAEYATEHPLCERCIAEGSTSPVEIVHHRHPIAEGGPVLPTNDDGLESLCRPCHGKAHNSESKYARPVNGPKPSHT